MRPSILRLSISLFSVGMALGGLLPLAANGEATADQVVSARENSFGAAYPQTSLDLIVATNPDRTTGKPDPGKVKAFKESHPDNRAQAEVLTSHNPPASYATRQLLRDPPLQVHRPER